MAQNKLTDLNNHLFAQLERLNDENLSTEQIEAEAKRAKAIIGLASQVVKSSKLTLDAIRMVHLNELDQRELPDSFGFKQLS